MEPSLLLSVIHDTKALPQHRQNRCTFGRLDPSDCRRNAPPGRSLESLFRHHHKPGIVTTNSYDQLESSGELLNFSSLPFCETFEI